MTISEAYTLGFDFGKNGANETNCDFRIFSNPVNTKAWENGMRDGEKSKDRSRKYGRNPYAVLLGKLGGLKGGKARAQKLTPERLSEIGKIAVTQRWKNQKEKEEKIKKIKSAQ